MERYAHKTPVYVKDLLFKVEAKESRKQPFGYLMTMRDDAPPEDYPPLWIPGHYEIACGGCDTIQKVDDVYASVRHFASVYHVLFEGIMVQDDVKRAIEVNKLFPMLVIALTTPIEECIKGIQARRDARGDERPLDPKNTVSRAERVKRNAKRLRDGGVEVIETDRETALKVVLERLGL
jgi:hypothetical protein